MSLIHIGHAGFISPNHAPLGAAQEAPIRTDWYKVWDKVGSADERGGESGSGHRGDIRGFLSVAELQVAYEARVRRQVFAVVQAVDLDRERVRPAA
jgi:hypothetical protein